MHEPISDFCKENRQLLLDSFLFGNSIETSDNDIRVAELFAGVGGFRIGLERASQRYKTVWNNQWEPSTKKQDASLIYCKRFGIDGHNNHDIETVPTSEIPRHDLLVGGFPCQDYSVATTLKRSGGIEGKKGVLWWQIYRIINESEVKPKYLFFENVDRLLKSPAKQRGRDFGIILASLSDLGYIVEWRVINAAEYGMPQRRRRTYIVAYRQDTTIVKNINSSLEWVLSEGSFAKAFPAKVKENCQPIEFSIEGTLDKVSAEFKCEFENAGIMTNRKVTTIATTSTYDGPYITLGQIILPEDEVPSDFFISDEDVEKWRYMKGAKNEIRTTPDGYKYKYSEGAMAFPDSLNKPSRTIITGEGGSGPSRFKHVIQTNSGRYRRLTPVELERLNMFPDSHTEGSSDLRRAFLMGNALVTGIIEKVGIVLLHKIDSTK
ncbi:MAG: DNA (cytosine-5-)-methyltransferase [Marinilabiliaceae bacterium]|nr:DNA (cytosine-5-)-methyltransferase [Marinilabiliaceae bacterium]